MLGRKVKRGLPLLQHAKATFDEQQLEKTDRESKLASKVREDARRGARKCGVKPGDLVIIERHTRAKGESRFGPKQYTVIQERNGSLVLNDEDGQVLKRHVSQTKKVSRWRDSNNPMKPVRSATSADIPPSIPQRQTTSTPTATAETADTTRTVRKRKALSHLQDYVRSLDTTQ